MVKDAISLVTPQEAVKLAKQRTIGDFDIVREIYNEFVSSLSEKQIKEENLYYSICLWETIWNAGRVQGIREERKRRRKVAENGVTKCYPIKK